MSPDPLFDCSCPPGCDPRTCRCPMHYLTKREADEARRNEALADGLNLRPPRFLEARP